MPQIVIFPFQRDYKGKPSDHSVQCATDCFFLGRNTQLHRPLGPRIRIEEVKLRFTENREDGGEDRCGGYQTVRQRAHQLKVDEKCDFNDSVGRPQGKVGHESNP